MTRRIGRSGTMVSGRLIAACILVLLTTGCAGEIIQKKMADMIGQPAELLFVKLGLPEVESRVAGRKFYAWDTQASSSYSVPQQQTGIIYGPYGQSTQTYSYITYRQQHYLYYCKLRVFVDARDHVVTYDFEGNEGGCGTFADRLNR